MDSEVMQFGLMSSLRTSNIIVDTLICLLNPFLFRFAYDAVDMQTLDDTFHRFLPCFGLSPRYSTRVIEAKHFMGTYGRVFDESDRNHILQQRKPSGRHELLEALDEGVVSRIQDDLEIEFHSNDNNFQSAIDVITLQVMTLPPLKDNGVVKESIVTYKLRAYGAQASERIDEYVAQCFQRYQDAIVAKKLSNKTRCMYVAVPSAKSEVSDAFAQHTNCHIVNISLAIVKANQELMDCILDLRMTLPNKDFPVKLSYEKILYVMEDIDCASEVVHARDDNNDAT
ncbi:hypothetical protein THRCLA_09352 [Thraustotheca clavata]|uniref:Uncharacterized protein n=1 Tax=Thraustotheca clavata TaxID=74557 RepID=A0A1V9YXC3_9STRA|nr:hypothetical protein THRCLA_09352 [Thraustotheca clavata]